MTARLSLLEIALEEIRQVRALLPPSDVPDYPIDEVEAEERLEAASNAIRGHQARVSFPPEDHTLELIQRQVGEWERERFPDAPLEVARLAIKCGLAEYERARALYLARISPENARQLEAAGAVVLIAILGDLERLPYPLVPDEKGPYSKQPFDFAAGLARKWAAVRVEGGA